MKKLLFSLALMFMLGGCGLEGMVLEDHGDSFLSTVTVDELNTKLQRGVTTKDDVEEMFGEPAEIKNTSLYETWTYAQARKVWTTNPFKQDRIRVLMIMFDAKGKVFNWHFNEQ